MMGNYHVRFGGGPMEKGRDNPLHLASGLPYITKDLAVLATGLRCRIVTSPTGYHFDPELRLAVPYEPTG